MLLPTQHIVHRGWRLLIPHGDIVDVITSNNKLFRGGGDFWPLMKIKMMLLRQSTYYSEGVAFFYVMMMMMMMIMIMIMIMIMTIVSVEQRPGWGEHIERMACWSSIRMGMVSYKLHQITTIFFSWVIVAKPPMSSANLYGLVQQERIWLRYPSKELVKGCK